MFELLLSAGGIKFPDTGYTGPGSQKLIRYDVENDVGYYGLVDQTDLFTFDQIEAAGKMTLDGTATNRVVTNKWHKFWFKGKVIYSPQRTIRTVPTWNNLYAAGFMYGTDDNGVFPPVGAEVNQLTVIPKITNGRRDWFKIRSPRMSLIDPTGNPYLVPPATDPNVIKSEFSLTAERVMPTIGIKDPWDNSGVIGSLVWGVESIKGDTSSAIVGLVNTNAYALNPAPKTTGSRNWLPVVELLPEDFDPFPAIIDNGPGAKKMIEYEQGIDTGYFGRVDSTDMPSIDVIEAAAATTLPGTRTADASNPTWLKFYRNGKVFYYPSLNMRTGVTWDNLYQAGFVYGTDDNGKVPGTPAVNQLRKLVHVDKEGVAWEFKVRLPSQVTLDPFPPSAFDDPDPNNKTRASECSQTFQRVAPYVTTPVKWDTLRQVEPLPLGIESNSGLLTNVTYMRPGWSSYSQQNKSASTLGGWYPVLELIGKFVPPQGQAEWTTAGTYEWTVPEGVHEVSVMLYSAGEQGKAAFGNSVTGGKGGQNRWKNKIPVNPGEKYSIVVGSGGTNETLSYGSSRGAQAVAVSKSSAFGVEVTPSSGTAIGTDMGGYGSPYGASATTLNTTAKGGDAPTFTGALTTVRSYGQSILNVPVPPTGNDGGTCGAGGSARTGASETGSATKQCGKGGDGGVRIMWGPNRAYPSTNIEDV